MITDRLLFLGEKVGIFRYNSAGQTDIPVNPGWGGRTILANASGPADDGDNTISQMNMIRCGYNGNYIKDTLLARSVKAETYVISYSVQNGGLYISKSQELGNISVTLIVTNI